MIMFSNIRCFEKHTGKGTDASQVLLFGNYLPVLGNFKSLSKRFDELKAFTAERLWWFKRRVFIDFTRIIGVGCFLARCVPSWTSSSLYSAYLDVKIYYVIIPLLVLDAVVVIIYYLSRNDKRRFYGERKYPLIVYSLFFGFPLGTIVKILVSLRFGNIYISDSVLLIFGVILCSLPMVAIFFFFLSAAFRCHSYGFDSDDCSKAGRKTAFRFFLLLVVSAYIGYYGVSLVPLLSRLFPSIVYVTKENPIFYHFEKRFWLTLLVPLWMTFLVLLTVGVHRTLHLMLESRLSSF